MAAIVKESLGSAAFSEKYWRSSDSIYLDEDHAFFKAVHGGKVNKVGITNFLQRAIYSNYSRASGKGYAGDNSGEGRILGGLYIVSLKGVHYEYPERTSGDHAPVEEVVEVIRSLAPKHVDVTKLDFSYARTAAIAAARPVGAIGIGTKPKTLDEAKAEGARMMELMKQRKASASASASASATTPPSTTNSGSSSSPTLVTPPPPQPEQQRADSDSNDMDIDR